MLITPNESGIGSAAEAIQSGSLVAFPTDTFFALGADGLNSDAVDLVFRIKGRNPGTPVPLLVSDTTMAEKLANEISGPLANLADVFWPGPLTIVVPAVQLVPEVVTARTGTVGLRVPDNDTAISLIKAAGTPITGTSCNLTGNDPIKEVNIVEQIFGNKFFGSIDAPCGDSEAPSTVISYSETDGGIINVLRQGAIGVNSLRTIVGDIVSV